LFANRILSADVNSGFGVTIGGLAAMVVGLSLGRNRREVGAQLLFVLVGVLIYRAITFLALSVGMPASAFRALTGLLLILSFAIMKKGVGDIFGGLKWN
jgi:ABC-type uncharacterized transport system permease subunit